MQYAVPVYRSLAQRPDISAHVLFRSTEGATQYFDSGYGRDMSWGSTVLDGYSWTSCEVDRAGWLNQLRAFKAVAKELRAHRFDAVLVDGYRSAEAIAGIVLSEIRRKPWFLLTDAIREGGQDRPALMRWIPRRAFRAAVRRARGIGCMSSASAEFVRSLGCSNAIARVVAVDLDVFSPPSNAEVANPAELRVIWVGRMLSWKRVDVLIRAALEVNAVRLRLVGAGPEFANLSKLAGNCERIEFVGVRTQTELPNEYNWAQVLAIPSDYEPFGVVAIEAAACGTPLLADPSAGSAGDLVGCFNAGWTVAAEDDWASSMRAIHEDRDQLTDASANALLAARDFAPATVAARLVALLRSP